MLLFFLFPGTILFPFLAHILSLMPQSLMFLLLGGLVHAGSYYIFLRLTLTDLSNISLFIIPGDGLRNGFFQFTEKKSIFRRT